VTVLRRHAVPVDSGAEQTGAVDADIGPLDQLEPADNLLAVH
jgi:hypothetical protein